MDRQNETVIPTQSIFTHEIDDDGDDDMTPARHIAKSLRNGGKRRVAGKKPTENGLG